MKPLFFHWAIPTIGHPLDFEIPLIPPLAGNFGI
jgi:hypothetical protein